MLFVFIAFIRKLARGTEKIIAEHKKSDDTKVTKKERQRQRMTLASIKPTKQQKAAREGSEKQNN